MLDHEAVFQEFSRAFEPAGGCHLFQRYENPALALDSALVHVFIPDLHMVRYEDAGRYDPSTFFVQGGALRALLEALHRLRHHGTLRVWQLGDLLDLWRSAGAGPAAIADGIRYGHAETLDALDRLRPLRLAGNHDFDLFRVWPHVERYRIVAPADGRGGAALVLHGDTFDFWEPRLPDALQAFAVRHAHHVYRHRSKPIQRWEEGPREAEREGARESNRLSDARLRSGAGGPARLMADPGAPPTANVFENLSATPERKFLRAARALADALHREHGVDVRLVVIGHTHHARLVLDRTDDGHPFVLMDCGAWVGSCRFGDAPPIRNAQVGVLAGNELRLYQLGATPW